MRIKGYSYRKIAKALGVGHETAHRYVKNAIAEVGRESAETAEEVKKIELARLDEATRVALEIMQLAGLSQRLAAIDRLVRVQERRAKYLGLDAPSKTAVTDPTGEHDALSRLRQLPDSVLLALVAGVVSEGEDASDS